MANNLNFLSYPNPAFVPDCRSLPDGTRVAHYPGSPVWCAPNGAMYVLDGDTFRRKPVSGLTPQKNYCGKTRNGCRIGRCYPHFHYRGVNYYAHKVMALSWIGPRPEGWEIDHLNGDILNWSLPNIRIVTVAENHRCAVILRARRMVARQDHDPSKDPVNMRPEDLLHLFSLYNVAGDVYEGD